MTREELEELLKDTFYTPRETADLLKCSRRYVYELMDQGDLSWFSVGTGKRIYKKSIIDYMLKERDPQSGGPSVE